MYESEDGTRTGSVGSIRLHVFVYAYEATRLFHVQYLRASVNMCDLV